MPCKKISCHWSLSIHPERPATYKMVSCERLMKNKITGRSAATCRLFHVLCINKNFELIALKLGLSLPKISLKMMKNVFYFMLKALFVLKIFKFLSWLFDQVFKSGLIRKKRLISKFMTSQPAQHTITILILLIKATRQWNLFR